MDTNLPALMNNPVFQTYGLVSAALVVILYGLGFWTAKTRANRKQVLNSEDVVVAKGAVAVDVEHVDVQRIKRAHLNAIENAVPFFVIGFLYSQTSPNPKLASGLFFTFLGLRLFHAIFYLGARQPFRTISFALGALVNLVMVVQVVRAMV